MLRPALVVAKSVTRKPLAQFLAEDAPDFESFCRFLKVRSKEGPIVPLVPNACQRRYLDARTSRDVILKARRQGFTTIALALDLWHFVSVPGANVRILCQSQTEHQALKDVTGILCILLDALEEHCRIEWDARPTATEWKLASGGDLRVVEAGASAAAASKKGRAGRISRLHCTELAFWEHAGETMTAIIPCVPTPEMGGEILFESTPNGAAPNEAHDKRNVKGAPGSAWFYWSYRDARDAVSSYRAHFFEWWLTAENRSALEDGEAIAPDNEEETYLANRGVPAEQLKWRRTAIFERGADTFAQEYPKDDVSCFLTSGHSFFDKAATAALLLKCVAPVHVVQIRGSGARGEVRFWRFADPAQTYVISADTSEGTGGDPCAAHVYERVTSRHMATLDGQLKPIVLAKWLAWLGKSFGLAIVAVERNNHGHAVLLALAAIEKYPRIFCDRDEEPGWMTHATTRTPALDRLEEAHRTGIWKPRDVKIVEQLPTFVVDDHNKAAAARGAHDEHPICGAIGLDLLTRPGVARGVGTAPILPF